MANNDLAHLTDDELQARIDRATRDREAMQIILEGIDQRLASPDELNSVLTTRRGPVGEMVNRRGVLSQYPLDEDRISRDLGTLRDAVVNRGVAAATGMDTGAIRSILDNTWAGIVRAGSGVTSLLTNVGTSPHRLFTGGGAEMFGPMSPVAAWPGANTLGITDTKGDYLLDPETRLAHNAQVRANVTALLTGITDPIAQDIYLSRQPRLWSVTGDIASMILMLRGGAPIGGATRTAETLAANPRFQSEAARRLAAIADKSGVSKTGLGVTLALGGAGALTGAITASEDDRGVEAFRYGLSTLGGAYLVMSALTGRPFGLQGRSILAAEQSMKFAGVGRLGVALREAPRLTVGYQLGLAAQGAALGAMAASSEGKSPVDALGHGLMEGLNWIGTDVITSRIGSVTRWGGLLDTAISKRAGEWAEQLGIAPNPAATMATLMRTLAPASIAGGAAVGAGAAAAAGADPLAGAELGSAAALLRSWGIRRLRSTLPGDTYRKLMERGVNGLSAEELAQVSAAVTRNIVEDTALHNVANDAEAIVLANTVGKASLPHEHVQVAREILALESQLRALTPGEAMPTDPAALAQVIAIGGKLFALRERNAQMLSEYDTVFLKHDVYMTPDGERARWVEKIVDDAVNTRDAREVASEAAEEFIPPGIRGLADAATNRMGDDAAALRKELNSPAADVDELKRAFDAPSTSELPPVTTAPTTTVATDAGARKVAAAGANRVAKLLPNSVTPQAVTRAPLTLDGARTWAAQHGLAITIDDLAGTRVFTARTTTGDAITSAITLKDLYTKLGGLAQDAQLGAGGGSEAGRASVGALIGPVLGAPLGAMVQAWARDPDAADRDDPNYSGALLGAAVGTIAGALLGATAAGMKANRAGKKVIELFAPPPTRQMDTMSAIAMVGKPGVTKGIYLSMPIAQQIEHRTSRLTAAARRDAPLSKEMRETWTKKAKAAGMSVDYALQAAAKEARRARVAAAIRKYVPTHLPLEHWNTYVDTTLAAAREAGYTAVEANALLRGSLVHMLTDYRVRVNPADVNLLHLSRSARGPLGTATSIDDMRRIVSTARVMSGPDLPMSSFHRNAAHANFQAQLTPDAVRWQEIQAVADKADFQLRGLDPVDVVNRGFLSAVGLRTPENFRTTGEQLSRAGDAAGDKMLQLHAGLMGATESIRVDVRDTLDKLKDIFKGVSTSDRMQIRKILENADHRADVKVNNPQLYKVAVDFRTWMDDWARKVGMDPGMRIEDYFPWIYSSRTMQELREAGRIPTDIVIPLGSGIPEYKVFKHLRERGVQQLGEILDDPLEVGTLYAYGAARKYHLDHVLTQFDGAWFKELAQSRPFDAADMGRWLMDVYGMPGKQYIQLAATLRAIGLKVEEVGSYIPGLSGQDLFKDMMDRYFTGPGALDRFTRTARAWAFYTKLGGNFISPLVNLAQLATNTGADHSFASILIGGGGFVAQTAGAAALEAVERALPEGRLSNFIHPWASGNAKLRMAKAVGVYSDASRNMMEHMAERVLREKGPGVGLTAAGAIAGGTAAFALTPTDSNVADTLGPLGVTVGGAALGSAFALAGPVLFRRMLRAPLTIATAPFQVAEAINRGMTAGAASRTFAQGMNLVNNPGARTRMRVGHALESTAMGAAVGGATAGTFGSEKDDRSFDPDAALLSAMVGGAMGVGVGLGRPPAEIAADRLRWLDKNARFIPDFRNRLQDMGKITTEEAERWYVRQALDMAQFRFGKEARPAALRTPVGEVAGALQSFTLNQMEFFGARWESFTRSLDGSGGALGLVKATAAGKVDMRIWRHMMLLGGAGGALAALTAGMFDIESDPMYWTSRVGLGFMPLLSYNSDSQQVQLNSLSGHILGPFIKDVEAGANFIWHMYDPVARANYDAEIDTLARKLFTAFRQLEGAPETLGAGLDKARQDGLADLVREQQAAASNLSYPGTAIRNRVEQYGQ